MVHRLLAIFYGPKVSSYERNFQILFSKKWVEHMKDEHNDLTPFKCEYEGCNFECKNPGILTNHSKIHRLYRNDLIFLTFRVRTGRPVTAVSVRAVRMFKSNSVVSFVSQFSKPNLDLMLI